MKTRKVEITDTFRRGWVKIHKGEGGKKDKPCLGKVRYVENTDPDAWWEWDFECLKCGRLLKEEEVEFVKD